MAMSEPNAVVGPASSWREAVREFKRELLGRVLDQAGGNRTWAARRLGIQRTCLLRLIRDLDIVASRGVERRVLRSASVPLTRDRR